MSSCSLGRSDILWLFRWRGVTPSDSWRLEDCAALLLLPCCRGSGYRGVAGGKDRLSVRYHLLFDVLLQQLACVWCRALQR